MTAIRFSPALNGGVREYLRAFYRRCDVVIAPSRYMKDRLAQWGVDAICTDRIDIIGADFVE